MGKTLLTLLAAFAFYAVHALGANEVFGGESRLALISLAALAGGTALLIWKRQDLPALLKPKPLLTLVLTAALGFFLTQTSLIAGHTAVQEQTSRLFLLLMPLVIALTAMLLRLESRDPVKLLVLGVAAVACAWTMNADIPDDLLALTQEDGRGLLLLVLAATALGLALFCYKKYVLGLPEVASIGLLLVIGGAMTASLAYPQLHDVALTATSSTMNILMLLTLVSGCGIVAILLMGRSLATLSPSVASAGILALPALIQLLLSARDQTQPSNQTLIGVGIAFATLIFLSRRDRSVSA